MKLFCILTLLTAGAAYAHQQPTTLVALDVNQDQVAMNLQLPLSELELAFGHGVTNRPEQTVAQWGPALRQYLASHIRPVSSDGRAWRVDVRDMAVQRAEQTQSGVYQEVSVNVALVPPAGATARMFTLRYDVIMHQVVTHKALVSVRNDWDAGRAGMEPTEVGVIQVNTETTQIAPLEVRLGEGSAWAGFAGMVRLGMQHIKEGTDHLLFLLVLLLPATLLVNGGRWGGFAGTHNSLARLVGIVTAFTAGHSITLLLGALGWVRLPQQPVEVLIAMSILVSAVHAVRPVFPGKEMYVAGGFGLVHGLAFATVLADLQLGAGRMALSILGFNLGIELMQLFVIAMTVPWLILLSQTPAHGWVRTTCAVLAGMAAAGWIANRVSGQSNVIEGLMKPVTGWAPLGILFLALVAIMAYLYGAVMKQAALSQQEENRT